MLGWAWTQCSFAQAIDSSAVRTQKPVLREWQVWTGIGSATAATWIGLNQLWYADYPKTAFHWTNDNAEWLQMDKLGHGFSAYHLSRGLSYAFEAAGNGKRQALWKACASSWAYMAGIEVMDGFSAQWGASAGDLLANTSGCALLISQEYLWKAQRIIPKFSYHPTPYPALRPNLLGQNSLESLIKDYNGQTYWLSANIKAFAPQLPVPEWLNVAVGYGGRGMIMAQNNLVNDVFFPDPQFTRNYYLSLDVDLSRIHTQHRWLKWLLEAVNTLKIPAPTLSWSEHGKPSVQLFYF